MKLKGTFSPPGDKSISHRIALFSLLSEGTCRAFNMADGDDVRSSLDAVSSLGCGVRREPDSIVISGAGGSISAGGRIDCGNSGTTMRIIMGALAGAEGAFTLDGDESLRKRPMERIATPLRMMGAHVETSEGRSPVRIWGQRLTGIEYELPVASAQLKSAIMLAGIQADGPTVIKEPTPSRDHTERLLKLCGAKISHGDGLWRLERSQLRLPHEFHVPGDISSAAFFLCAATLVPGSEVTADGVLLNPTRAAFLNALERMGAEIEIERLPEASEPWGKVTCRFSPDLKACLIAADEIPSLVDEVPILALVATQAHGTTRFEGVRELRIKETDRLEAIATQLGSMGANLVADEDTLTVHGPTPLNTPERLDSFGDHRIAMTLRLANVLAGADPFIQGEESVSISYPLFHETLRRLQA